jgi:hypothetical protein
MDTSNVTAAARYAALEMDRRPYLRTAEICAKLTIPSLLPEEGHSPGAELPTPYQSVGARGVNNLASKLLLALLPPNSPFFRLQITDKALAELSQDESAKTKAEAALAQMEKKITDEADMIGLRSPLFEALRRLVTSGNVLIYIPQKQGARVFPMNQYVIVRDPEGTVLQIIIKETVGVSTLDADLQALHTASSQDSVNGEAKADGEDNVAIYTVIKLADGKHVVHQEMHGMIIEGTQGSYAEDASPYIPLRWSRIDGENWGRGYIEEYLGDLTSLEGLSRALLEGTTDAARVVFAISAGGPRVADFMKAENGSAIEGNGDLIKGITSGKTLDLQFVDASIDKRERRLAQAFLMNTSVQRSGERVTAEEIRYVAGELEDALGGIYSILAQEFQRPLVARLRGRMQKAGLLPKLPTGTIRVTISTGLEALGRGHDMQRLKVFVGSISELGPEAFARINIDNLITRLGTSIGIDMEGLVKTAEQIEAARQAEQAQMQQAQLMDGVKGAIPGVAGEMAKAAVSQQPE